LVLCERGDRGRSEHDTHAAQLHETHGLLHVVPP
jgi:hypothetical protein